MGRFLECAWALASCGDGVMGRVLECAWALASYGDDVLGRFLECTWALASCGDDVLGRFPECAWALASCNDSRMCICIRDVEVGKSFWNIFGGPVIMMVMPGQCSWGGSPGEDSFLEAGGQPGVIRRRRLRLDFFWG